MCSDTHWGKFLKCFVNLTCSVVLSFPLFSIGFSSGGTRYIGENLESVFSRPSSVFSEKRLQRGLGFLRICWKVYATKLLIFLKHVALFNLEIPGPGNSNYRFHSFLPYYMVVHPGFVLTFFSQFLGTQVGKIYGFACMARLREL